MSVNKRLLLLFGVFISMVIITIIFIPYKIEEKFINRRTGVESRFTTILLFYRPEGQTVDFYNLQQYGELTAPDELLPISKTVYLFPWSRRAFEGHWLSEYHVNNFQLKITISRAFLTPVEYQEQEKALTPEAFAELIERRVKTWNELEVSDSIDNLNKQLEQENNRLFPDAWKKFAAVNTVTVKQVIKKPAEKKDNDK